MPFDDATTCVLIGGYLLKDAADDDYEAAIGRAAAKWPSVGVNATAEGR
jgi:hypothetical protein